MPEPWQDILDRLRTRLNNVLRGKSEVIDHVLTCLLAQGHILIEDLPGLGKTTLAKALAQAIGGPFARIQCTPDLLPSDVTGFNIFNQKTREFEFMSGPVFADVLLADEINRATPRTQSALLESMAERQVTIDNVQHCLSETFFVIATQNPVEHHGTYPLPEAQLDRFAMKLRLGYPDRDDELTMLATAIPSDNNSANPEQDAQPILQPGELFQLQEAVAHTHMTRGVMEYLLDLARKTRKHPQITLGLSPRALLIWQRVAQARAFLLNRRFVTPDDVLHVARPVIRARLGADPSRVESLVEELLDQVSVPVESLGSM